MAKQQSQTSSKKTETEEKEAPAKEAPAKEAASTAPPPKDPAPAAAKRMDAWRAKAPLALAFAGVGVGGILIGRFSTISSSLATPPPVPSVSASAGPQEPEQMKFDLEERPTNQKHGLPLRPMDRDIFDELIAMRIDRKQMSDVFPGKPYRVGFHGSIAEKHINDVFVDLDRDGTWDEHWTFKPGAVERTVNHDPNTKPPGMPVMYTLANGRWQMH